MSQAQAKSKDVAAKGVTESESLATSAEFANEARVRVKIHRGEGEAGKRPQPLGINGHVLLVPRETEVNLPAPYAELLENSRVGDVSEDGSEVLSRPRFGYSILGRSPAPAAQPAAAAA